MQGGGGAFIGERFITFRGDDNGTWQIKRSVLYQESISSQRIKLKDSYVDAQIKNTSFTNILEIFEKIK